MSTYIEQREGGFYIADTRVSLDSIIHAFQDGESPEGILRSFPNQERLWNEVETQQNSA
jgi:uncharacterized protein (DUF433 family)